jgi:phage terminase Nu1 subunit (DNA packaging protein)
LEFALKQVEYAVVLAAVWSFPSQTRHLTWVRLRVLGMKAFFDCCGGTMKAPRHVRFERISITELARLFELTAGRVYQLVQDGVLPRAGRGVYDFTACVQSYLRHLRNEIAQAGRDADTFGAHRARLTKARADMMETQLAAMREALIPADQIEAAWQEYCEVVRSKILALPDKIAPRLATAPRQPAAVALILRHALFEVLAEIADKAHERAPAPSERSGGALPL